MVFRDRIEWSRATGPGLLGRAVLSASTEGSSELLGGGTDGNEIDVLPIDATTSITAERAGLHSRVSLRTRGSSVELEVSRSKAAKLQETLRGLLSTGPTGR